jgi:hypothetical protein
LLGDVSAPRSCLGLSPEPAGAARAGCDGSGDGGFPRSQFYSIVFLHNHHMTTKYSMAGLLFIFSMSPLSNLQVRILLMETQQMIDMQIVQRRFKTRMTCANSPNKI